MGSRDRGSKADKGSSAAELAVLARPVSAVSSGYTNGIILFFGKHYGELRFLDILEHARSVLDMRVYPHIDP